MVHTVFFSMTSDHIRFEPSDSGAAPQVCHLGDASEPQKLNSTSPCQWSSASWISNELLRSLQSGP